MTKIPQRLYGRSGTYEVTPFRIQLSVTPEFLDSKPEGVTKQEGRWLLESVVGGHTATNRVDKIQRETETLLRDYFRRFRGGDRTALAELLDRSPAFIRVDWVAEAVLRLRKSGLFYRRRGRPKGRFEIHPLIVVGLVEHLRRKREKNKEQAFRILEELGIFPSYDSAKATYYRAVHNSSIRAIFLENPEATALPPIEEIEAVDRAAVKRFGRESQPFAVIERTSAAVRKPDGALCPILDGAAEFYTKNQDRGSKIGSMKLSR